MKSIYMSFLAILIVFTPFKTINALSHDWISVPKSQYGEQLWDQASIHKNQDGSIRVFSKFIPKSTTEITQDILYTMDINCSEISFRENFSLNFGGTFYSAVVPVNLVVFHW